MDSDRIRLHTKSGAEYTERLPGMVENFKRLPMRSAIINGELCLVAADGLPLFHWLLHDAHALAGRNGQDVFRFRSGRSLSSLRTVLVGYMMIDDRNACDDPPRSDRDVGLEHDPARAAVIAAAI